VKNLLHSAMIYIYVAHKFSKYHMIIFLLIITVFLSVPDPDPHVIAPPESRSEPVIICTNLVLALDLDLSINKE
jgi:hypothetical protein